jgi:catechol 2,3-dioxygenase-like lactoylglutathione lyase family enzyme
MRKIPQVGAPRRPHAACSEVISMFHHVQISVSDFGKSLRFFRAALEPLGFVAQHVDEAGKSAGFGPPGHVQLWIGVGTPSKGPVHIAFVAKDEAAVKAFHAGAMGAGGRDHGGPGPRPDYGAKYWAAFVLDPDGNNLEAVIA